LAQDMIRHAGGCRLAVQKRWSTAILGTLNADAS
jgi:hypothetical protein